MSGETQTPETPEAPQGGQTAAPRTFTMTEDEFHARLNRELAGLKDKWREQGRSEVAKELDELREFKTKIEERDLSELEKAQRALAEANTRQAAYDEQMKSLRWRAAVGEALRQSVSAGTMVMPQFVGSPPQITGKESETELLEMARATVGSAFQTQMNELKALGFAPPPQPPQATPGVDQGNVRVMDQGYFRNPGVPEEDRPEDGGVSEIAKAFMGMSKRSKQGPQR